MTPDQEEKTCKGFAAVRAALSHLPAEPGVYFMKDSRGRVIYVGKAKRLRTRVANYARPDKAPTWYRHRIEAMVQKVRAVEFVVTSTEKEALLLENTLIKQHRPRFNVDLRDDKQHIMFRLEMKHVHPRLSVVRRSADDGARYFGPFDKAGMARKTLRLLQRIFPLRRCSDHTLKNRERPCLDFDTGRCSGPCTGEISIEEYQALARQMAAFFSGKGRHVVKELEAQMKEASVQENYEAAALYRDRMQALERTLERQSVAKASEGDMDAVALHDDDSGLRLAVISVRSGRVIGSRVFDLAAAALSPEEILSQSLLTLYDQGLTPPPLVLISHMPPDPGLVVEVLGERAGRKVELRNPQRGGKMGFLELARMNAAQPRKAKGEDRLKVLEVLGRKLGLDSAPETMECMDISHFGGRFSVASVAAFKDGEPDKSQYRRYKVLSNSEIPDDYSAMGEVVSRRLGGERPPPDLLVVDGGKGQLNVAFKVLENLPSHRRPGLCALAKGREGQADKVYLPGRKNPLDLGSRHPGLFLLMRLRDEAHRFAITYHRQLRAKALRHSLLEEVPGIGPKKRRMLFKAFGSLAAIRAAKAEEITGKAGLDRGSAARVEAFLAALDIPQPPG